MNQEKNINYLAHLLHGIEKFAFLSLPQQVRQSEAETSTTFLGDFLRKIKCLDSATISLILSKVQKMAKGAGKEKSAYIVSVLENIGESGVKKQTYFYKPEPISIGKVMPTEGKFADLVAVAEYQTLLENLEKEFQFLAHQQDLDSLANSLYYLLQKYTARVSSIGYDVFPDVSLFDYNRAMAGLANCWAEDMPEAKPYLLIKGDLSGIQKFIYADIDTTEAGEGKGVARNLRGKSFYISLLTDFLAEQVVRRLDLAEANIIFSGGGHFNIIAPNTTAIQTQLTAFEKDTNLYLLDKIGTVLSLNLAFRECEKDFYTQANQYFYEVNQVLDRNKTQRYKGYLDQVFQKYEGRVKNSFKDYESLGTFLPYSDYLVQITLKEGQNTQKFRSSGFIVANFEEKNTYFLMFKDRKDRGEYDLLHSFLKKHQSIIKEVKLIKKNDTQNFLEYNHLSSAFSFPLSFAFRFVGNYAPKIERRKEEKVLTFEDIASINYENLTQDLSYPQLAVMRLDVDNLGGIFAFGLGEKASFSRVATLSRELHLFFSGYANELAKEYQLYITYSGGDDAFIIGSWYNVAHFAQRLYQDFKKFTCKNPFLSFSAGVFMCNEHYPVAKFAEDASEAEHHSKSEGKNRITIFDHTLTWESYCEQIKFAENILQFIEDESNPVDNKEKLARSFIHRLLRIIKSVVREREELEGGKVHKKGSIISERFYKNIAQLHYLFARRGFHKEKLDRAKEVEHTDKDSFTDKIARIVVQQILNHFADKTKIKDYLVSTHYILLKTRTLNKN